VAEMNESLSDKLRALGVNTGAGQIPSPAKKKVGIEDIIAGEFLPTAFGDVFCATTITDSVYAHGIIPMISRGISQRLAFWNKSDPSVSSINPSEIIFLDTETTGLSGGTGTLPFMIGLGWFSDTGFITTQIFIRNPGEEPAQLAKLDELLSNAGAIVTYNGKAFDIPILQSRYIMNGLISPFKTIPHFDLLPLARRLWRRRLDNRGLKDIETAILGYSRSSMEVPGWEIPILYFNYLRSLDPTPLAGVFYHNVIDIQSLAALFLYINQILDVPESRSNFEPVDHLSLAVFFEDNGDIENAVMIYDFLLNYELPDVYANELRLRYGRLLKRSRQFDQALRVLDTNSDQQDIHVMIQLAKVLEHQTRDFESALHWTQLAQEKMSELAMSLPGSQYNQLILELSKRKLRLLQKFQAKNHQNLEE
jgi:uncharacterized protein YprB with RNaseH-like and TPR domain